MDGKRPLVLQPMGVSETIDVAIALYRRHWKPLMAIAAVIQIPFQVINQWVMHVGTHPVLIGGRIYTQGDPALTLLLAGVSVLFISPLLRGAMTRAVGDAYMGETPSWKEGIRFALSKFWLLLGAVLLSSLIVGAGLLLLIVPGIIFAIRYTFVTMAVVLEDARVTESLKRSWHLSAGRFWRILGTLLLAGLIAAIATSILVLPSLFLTFNPAFGSATWVVRALLSAAAAVITAPFGSAVAVLLYFDSRIRKEGFDIAVLAREIG